MVQRFMNASAMLADYSFEQKLKIIGNVIQYYINKSVFRRNYLLKRIHANKMYLDLQREGVSRALAFFGTREELETKVFKQALKEGMVMVDLGANIGYYTLMAASIVGPRGKIYAIEPFPANFEVLAKNVEVNNFSDIVELSQMAISDRLGIINLFVGAANNLHTVLPIKPSQSTISVETMTLDKFLEDKGEIDFLRMDVEGAERLVFNGMSQTLNQKLPPRIFFEVHPIGEIDPDPELTAHIENFVALGYQPKYVISSSNPWSLKYFADLDYQPDEIARSGNALFSDFQAEDLPKVAARRPKITRALLLIHQHDTR